MQDYRKLIREKRKAAGMSQSQLAKLLGISQPYMNQIETGSRNPTLPLLMKICGILEIPMFGENTQNE